jgi:hypothetical protein
MVLCQKDAPNFIFYKQIQYYTFTMTERQSKLGHISSRFSEHHRQNAMAFEPVHRRGALSNSYE